MRPDIKWQEIGCDVVLRCGVFYWTGYTFGGLDAARKYRTISAAVAVANRYRDKLEAESERLHSYMR